MNIKPKTAVLAILTLSTIGLATAKAPDIDPARIDSMVAEVLRQADQHPNQTAKPDGQAIRKDVVTRWSGNPQRCGYTLADFGNLEK